MAIRDFIKSGLKAGKKAIDFAMEHQALIKEMICNNFNSNVIENLQKKQILISENSIFNELQRLDDLKDWHVEQLKCMDNFIEITCKGEVLKTTAQAWVRFRISELTISEAKQEAVLEILDKHVTGQGFLGKITCAFINFLTGQFFQNAIMCCQWSKRIIFSEDGRYLSVSLAGLPAIESMLEQKIPQIKDSIPLRLIALKNVKHIEGGVILELEVAEKIENFAKCTAKVISSLKDVHHKLCDDKKGDSGLVITEDNLEKAYQIFENKPEIFTLILKYTLAAADGSQHAKELIDVIDTDQNLRNSIQEITVRASHGDERALHLLHYVASENN